MPNKVVCLALFLGALSFAQETPAAGSAARKIRPRPDSPTAMTRCGATLDQVKANGFAVRYEFTGDEVLTDMQYCVGGKTVRIDSVHKYQVPSGHVGWLNGEGKVALEGCVNIATCKGCLLPAPPPPPPATTKTILIHWVKENFDTEGDRAQYPTGTAELCAGSHCVEPNEDGKVDQVVPDADYDISENIKSEVWETVDISLRHITKGERTVYNITVKNRQKRPEPAPTPRTMRERRPRPERNSQQPAAVCEAIFTDQSSIWPGIRGGEAASGEWLIGGLVFSNDVKASFNHRMLYDVVGHKPGSYPIAFNGRTATGMPVHCKMVEGIELVKKGRNWFWKLPGVHCVYAYTAGIKDWSKWGAAEKLGFCPAEAALAWWLWPVEAGHAGLVKLPVPRPSPPL